MRTKPGVFEDVSCVECCFRTGVISNHKSEDRCLFFVQKGIPGLALSILFKNLQLIQNQHTPFSHALHPAVRLSGNPLGCALRASVRFE